MTLSAQPHGEREVTITTTYGPVFNSVHEDVAHARYFWHQLGTVLDQIENKEKEA